MTILPQPDDELTIRVGAKEIYEKLLTVETKLDALPTVDHELRIRALERWRYAAGGALALSSAAIGWLIQIRGGA